ncbi:interferon-related developmental regulator 2 isoform X4 [Bos indicus x Bos taurus]|uniref:Interferon related developmental regulator 2 n=1 Tax=Bos indicus x Bos taurus TaxID=30522 RepID=A0A4W2HKT8_BOBOX|nr:interferon-related developmental regulator 2 isoform X4 [Bos indicus x Bos taurus]
MPRARKGSAPRRGGQRRGGGARSSTQADSGSSEDEAASEAHSTTSECASQLSAAAEEGLGGDAVEEQGQQEDLEEKVKEYVDCLTDKSAKTRQGALESLRLALAARLLPDFLLERRLTLADALEKCLKKGKGEEQALAAAVLGLLCVQMGPGPKGEEFFHSLQPLLVSVLSDSTASLAARLHCASALGLGCYVAAADIEDPGLLPHLLGRCFQPVLQRAGLQSRGPHQPAGPSLRCPAGLGAAPHHLPQHAHRPHPGQEDFVYEDTEALCSELRTLATDSNKYRAKADRRRQRSTFRAVLHFVEGGECEEETIRFGLEVLYVDSWARRRVYAAFKDALGSGMHHHLQNNELLRDIFGLGPVLVLDAAALKACKISRFEKHLYNAAAFRARTKARSRVRDKRADVL